MKVHFFLLVMILLFSCHQTQNLKQEVVYKTDNGETWVRQFFRNSNMIKSEGRYKDSSNIGIYRVYTINGLINFEENYNFKGELNGIFRLYYDNYPNGNFIKQEGNYYNGKQIGNWKFYRPDGTIYLSLDLDSNQMVTYYSRFDLQGHFLKDSSGLFSCDTSELW